MDIKYKGISKEDIMQIQRINMPQHGIPEIDLDKLRDIDIPPVQKCIDEIAERESRNRDIYVICEMAKRYLETLQDKKYCSTCKWYEVDVGVCVNGDSEHRADFRCLDDTCSAWSRMKD